MRMRKVQRVWNRIGARMEAEGESLRPAFSCLASHAKKLLFPLSFAFKLKCGLVLRVLIAKKFIESKMECYWSGIALYVLYNTYVHYILHYILSCRCYLGSLMEHLSFSWIENPVTCPIDFFFFLSFSSRSKPQP